MSTPGTGQVADPLDSPRALGLTLRGGALRTAAWGASAVLSFVSIPLLVRHLGVPEFGRYVAVLAIVNIAALASDLGLAGLALREWSASTDAARRGVMRTLLGMRLAVAVLGALVAIAFALVAGYSGRLVAGTALACVGLFAQVFGDFALVGLAASLRFGPVALVELTRAFLGTAFVVVLVIAGAGLVPFFGAYSAAAVGAALLAARLARGSVPLVPALRRAAWRPLVADTAAYAAATAVHVVYFRVVMVVISRRSSALQAGLFATVFRLVEFSAAVGGALAGTMTPVLARASSRDGEELRSQTRRLVLAALAVGLAAAALLALAAPLVMDLIGGHRTRGGVAVLRIEAPAVAATFCSFAMGAVLLTLRRYRELLAINVVALALALGLALLLVPDHGARGGAVAALAGELWIAGAQAVALRRALRSLPVPSLPSAERP